MIITYLTLMLDMDSKNENEDRGNNTNETCDVAQFAMEAIECR